MAAVARHGNVGNPRGGPSRQAQEGAGWTLSSSAPADGGHPAPGPALGLTRTLRAGSGTRQPLGSGVRCGFLTRSGVISQVGCSSSPLRLAAWDWQSRTSQGWKRVGCGAARLRWERRGSSWALWVQPWRGTPWDEQESSCSHRKVLQGQGGGEGLSWVVWGVFPCAVSVHAQRRVRFTARELAD